MIDLTYIRLRYGNIEQILNRTQRGEREELKQFVASLPDSVIVTYLENNFFIGPGIREPGVEYIHFIPTTENHRAHIVATIEKLLLEYHYD